MFVRSWLCAPALNSKLLTKAAEVAADVAVLDLEDSVPLPDKDAARESLCKHFAVPPRVTTSIRINSLRTQAGLRDLLFLAEQGIVPDILQLPKAHLPSEVDLAASVLEERGLGPVCIFAIIETVESLWTLRKLDEAPPALSGLIFGAADFAVDMGVQPTCADLRFVRQEISLAARRFGILAIDSPCFHLRDQSRLDCETQTACDLGFAGKIAIHPGQVPTINTVFTPSSKALDDARKLVDASERNPENSILRIDDGMVGPPFLKYARQVLSSSRAFGRR